MNISSETALLVMDFQAGIVGRLPQADELVERTRGAIDAVRTRGGHIGYVRVALDDADLAKVPAHSRFAQLASQGDFGPDAPATQVDARLAPQPEDIVVRKTRVGAFSTTDLDEQLRERGIATLLLAGISTSGVVLSTVRDGADRDYALVVVEDCCADPQADVHSFLVERVFPRQAEIVSAAQL